jgi:hypothetical protein
MTEPLLTRSQWAAMMRAPLRDKSYQLTGLGAAVTDFLAWKRVNGAAERTLDQYERDLARGCLLYPERTLETVESADILQVLLLFPAPSRHRARAAWSSFFKWAYLWELIERNPIDRVPQIASEPQRYIETFRDAEVEALISLPLRDGALMAILLDAGLRRSEACNLQQRRCTSSAPSSSSLRARERKIASSQCRPASFRSSLTWPSPKGWETRPTSGTRSRPTRSRAAFSVSATSASAPSIAGGRAASPRRESSIGRARRQTAVAGIRTPPATQSRSAGSGAKSGGAGLQASPDAWRRSKRCSATSRFRRP